MKKVLFTATVDSHILQFHIPYLNLFKESGYEVHVATNGTEEIPYCDVKHIISFERSPFKYNNIKAIKKLRKIINKEKFDIIHTHTPMGSAVTRLASKKARKKYKTRVIYTAHGFHFYKGSSKINWLVFYPVEKYLAKYTDTLITINKEDYNLAKNKFNKRCRDINYIPGVGIDPKKFNFEMTEKEKISFRKTLGLNKDDFVLIFPAELNKNKNQILLINVMDELVKKNKNIHLLLPGIDSYNGYYQRITKDKNLDKNIHFLGYRKDIPKLLKISNVALSSSLREGLPINIIEALSIGLPIVTLNARGVKDILGNSNYIIDINSNNFIDDFVDNILKIYNMDTKKIDKIKKQNKELVKKYHIDNIIEEYKKVYFRKKKVLHVLSSNKFSGAENVACTIISNMSDEYDMAYASPFGPIKETIEERNIKYYSIKKLNIKNLKKIINIYNPDIIHAHDNKATVISSFISKKYKLISHIHGNNKIMNTLNLKTILFNYCSRKVDKFIWVSDSSLNNYYFKKNIYKKSIVLYNIVNTSDIINKSKLYNVPDNYDLCFLGRLGYPKNVIRLIEIVKSLKTKKKNISLAIIGDGSDRNLIEKKILEYKLTDNVKLYGFLSNPYSVLYNSKILIMTSIYEGTPMCALEAQCLGKPIIATPVDGLKEIVKNDVNGFLSDNDNILVKKILELLMNKNIYSKYSENTRKMFNKYNDMDNYIVDIKNIYENDKRKNE